MLKRIAVCAALIFITSSALVFYENRISMADASAAKEAPAPHKIIAPDFNLQSLTGKPWRLNDYKGKVLLIDFTTTWCPYCIKDIPNLKKIHERYTPQGLEFVAIYINESQKRVSSFIAKQAIPYNILLDPEARAARLYGVKGVPTKIVVDRDGSIVCWMCEDKDMEKHLERLLKK